MGCTASSPAATCARNTNNGEQTFRSTSSACKAIDDKYESLPEVQAALRRQGLESSNLIIAVDFTKSNEWTGQHSFHGQNLHEVGGKQNPYEQAISIVGETLSAFDDDGLIPAYGFGDISTKDQSIFSFRNEDVPCDGLNDVLERYRELVPHVRLSGPTSFAAAIHHAINIVETSGGQYHILVIVADGQVTRSVDIPDNAWSTQEADTVQAIVEASNYPLSIVMVGVGDGPWDQMEVFDDKLPQRRFDNFQFVNFTKIASKYSHDIESCKAEFALAALMEIPDQYKAIQLAGICTRTGSRSSRPPVNVLNPPRVATPARPSGSGSGRRQGTDRTPPARDQGRTSSATGREQGRTSCAAPGRSSTNPMFNCPITKDIMQDPVLAADGFTYERSAIQHWLAANSRSPMTNVRLLTHTLVPNHALRSAILESAQRAELGLSSRAHQPGPPAVCVATEYTVVAMYMCRNL